MTIGVYTGYMCECCWSSRGWGAGSPHEAYEIQMREHERRGCACTQPGERGARMRAGQWWDEDRKCDVREGVAEREAAALRGEVKT